MRSSPLVIGCPPAYDAVADSNSAEVSNAAPYVKAAVRDMKAYRDSKNYRKIPIGYSAGAFPLPTFYNAVSNTRQPMFLAFAPCFRITSPAATTMPNVQSSIPSTSTNGAATLAMMGPATRSFRRMRQVTTSPYSSQKRAAEFQDPGYSATKRLSWAQRWRIHGPGQLSMSG